MSARRHIALRCLGIALAIAAAPAPAADRFIVVSSGDAAPYQETLSGIQKLGHPVDVLQLNGENDPVLAAALVRAGRDTAIVTLGGKAAAAVAAAAPGLPAVNCMLIGGREPKPGGATIPVPLGVPIETRIGWLKRLLPSARSVGILFDPAQNDRQAAADAAALRRAGYTTVLEPVGSPTVLPSALARLTNAVDLLLAIPDTTVYAREYSRALLLFSFRNRIPLDGPSEAWVRAGALYAVDWDYADLGRYCGALAVRQQAGGRGAPPAPARTRVVVNLRSAEQLRVKWDAELLRAIDKVYE